MKMVWDAGVWDFGRFNGGVYVDDKGNYWWCYYKNADLLRRWPAPSDYMQWTLHNFQAAITSVNP